jgi:hypothetical protein
VDGFVQCGLSIYPRVKGHASGTECADWPILNARGRVSTGVDTVFYNGPIATPNPNDTDHGHYWIGGAEGNEGRWSTRRGPVHPEIVWDFFARHPRDGASLPDSQPRIMLIGPDPLRVELGSSFVDPGTSAEDGEDGALPVSADCSGVDTGRAGRYTCAYRATDSDGHSAVALRTVEVFDRAAPQPNCAAVSAAPVSHILAGRAVRGGWFGLRTLATGDAADIGYSLGTSGSRSRSTRACRGSGMR